MVAQPSVQFTQLCLTLQPHELQHSLSITNSQSSPKPMSVELVMPSNHLILCRPLLLLPSVIPSIIPSIHHHYLILEHFPYPERTFPHSHAAAYLLSIIPILLSSYPLPTTNLLSISLNLSNLDFSYK